jgi:protease-4
MRRFIVGFLATIGTLVLLAVVAGVAFFASGPFSPKPLPQQMVLSLDLRSLPPETTSTGLLSGGLFGSSRDIVETVQLLWQAADDPRVIGLYVEIGDEAGGLARVQELRQAIAHFRGKGKFAVELTSPTTISPPRSTRSGCSPVAASASPASPSKRRSLRAASTSSV